MAIRSVHPFPARMASDIALRTLNTLAPGSTILDPMAGSGTVLCQAAKSGFKARGFDVDPLAVLMSRVATSICKPARVKHLLHGLLDEFVALDGRKITGHWIDRDPETRDFVSYWFGPKQRRALRKLSYLLATGARFKRFRCESDVIRLALSRIIVTKESKASLARDTSHSRPHKVIEDSDFDVIDGLVRSVDQVLRLLHDTDQAEVSIELGDARALHSVEDETVDAVVTSPPYLNAIDYLRGHRLALVWLGYTVSALRRIRSDSIGTEVGLMNAPSEVECVAAAGTTLNSHEPRVANMVRRYARDMLSQLGETSRVLKPGGVAVYVVGNSCLRGTFVRTSRIVAEAARQSGLELLGEAERVLPEASRYLPMPKSGGNALAKRMRTEVVLQFQKP